MTLQFLRIRLAPDSRSASARLVGGSRTLRTKEKKREIERQNKNEMKRAKNQRERAGPSAGLPWRASKHAPDVGRWFPRQENSRTDACAHATARTAFHRRRAQRASRSRFDQTAEGQHRRAVCVCACVPREMPAACCVPRTAEGCRRPALRCMRPRTSVYIFLYARSGLFFNLCVLNSGESRYRGALPERLDSGSRTLQDSVCLYVVVNIVDGLLRRRRLCIGRFGARSGKVLLRGTPTSNVHVILARLPEIPFRRVAHRIGRCVVSCVRLVC